MRLKRRAGAAVIAAVTMAVLPFTAAADEVIHIAGTGGDGVLVHAAPSKSSARVGWLREGAVPQRECAVIAEYVGNVRYWFRITHNGGVGYIPSYYDDSHYKNMAELTAKYGIPQCGVATRATPASNMQSVQTWNSDGAVTWALAHARDPQPFDSACAYFVSKALWAGGLPRTNAWTDTGRGHGTIQHRPGTVSATEVNALVDYLKSNYQVTQTEITDRFAPNAKVSEAKPGDIIVYDDDNNGQFNHVALVVGFAPGTQYPDIAQWGNVDASRPGSHPRAEKTRSGWTWSSYHKTWIKAYAPATRAWLLHIDVVAVPSF